MPPPAPVETPVFGPEAFVLDAEQGVVTCPGGQQTATKARSAHDTGWKFVFARRQCAGCPLQAQCLATLPQKKGRSVIKNDYQAEYDAARARATTGAMRRCGASIRGSNASWPISCATTRGDAAGTGASGG